MPQLVTELYNLNMLYEQVGKDDTSLKRFVEIFLNTVPVDMKNLEEAIATKNADKTRSSAHKMKSSYMLMGAEWAKDLCFEMETIAKSGLEKEKLPDLFKELNNKFSEMVISLKN